MVKGGGGVIGTLAVFDVSESGRQIGEKLFTFLDPKQRRELERYVNEQGNRNSGFFRNSPCIHTESQIQESESLLTEIWEGELHFCLEQRIVEVCSQEIMLTAKEFDLLALLIRNPGRVFTFEMIMDLVWNEEDSFYSRKVIINHASNLRKKLRISDAVPDYIKSIRGVGYKFDSDCRGTT